MNYEGKFKVLIPFEPDTLFAGGGVYRIEKYEEDDSTPLYRGRALDKELRYWFNDRKISYSLDYVAGPVDSYLKYANNWVILFDNKDDALLFKLTWG
jgi:hypothetical protein